MDIEIKLSFSLVLTFKMSTRWQSAWDWRTFTCLLIHVSYLKYKWLMIVEILKTIASRKMRRIKMPRRTLKRRTRWNLKGWSYWYFFQVPIAIFLYLQVYQTSYGYLQVQSLHTSTHSYYFILASMKNKLCILQVYKTSYVYSEHFFSL